MLQDQVQSAENLSKGSRAEASPNRAGDSSKASQQAAVAPQDTQQKGTAALSSAQQRAEAGKQRQESEAAGQRRADLIDSITKQSPKGGQSQQARQLDFVSYITIRLSLPLFPYGCIYFTPLVCTRSESTGLLARWSACY